MPQDSPNPVTGTYMGGVPKVAPKALKGEQAGKSFASSEDLAKQAAMQEFLKLHPEWSGLGGAARRPPDFQKQFDAFYASKTKDLAGKPAPLGTPGPQPSPSPSPSPLAPPGTPGPGAPQASLQDVDTNTLLRILNS